MIMILTFANCSIVLSVGESCLKCLFTSKNKLCVALENNDKKIHSLGIISLHLTPNVVALSKLLITRGVCKSPIRSRGGHFNRIDSISGKVSYEHQLLGLEFEYLKMGKITLADTSLKILENHSR